MCGGVGMGTQKKISLHRLVTFCRSKYKARRVLDLPVENGISWCLSLIRPGQIDFSWIITCKAASENPTNIEYLYICD